MKFKDDARSRLHETSDRDCDNIPNVVSKIDHDVREPEAQTGAVTTLPVASPRLMRVRSADKRGQRRML
jgi:hypothetical protein